MEDEELKKIIEGVKAQNPFPEEVYEHLTEEEWKDAGNFLEEHDKKPALIFAKWGRMVWERCVMVMEDYLKK